MVREFLISMQYTGSVADGHAGQAQAVQSRQSRQSRQGQTLAAKHDLWQGIEGCRRSREGGIEHVVRDVPPLVRRGPRPAGDVSGLRKAFAVCRRNGLRRALLPADPRRGVHPDWHSFLFNFGRNEVRAFLLSCALFWLDKYHVDALRTDAVASMLYLDYSRPSGQWLPNERGGCEDLDAIQFLRTLNEAVYANYPDAATIAEESTAWPMVSRPVYLGGLGFGYKWDMGWMHDTLEYMQLDPVFRKYHHDKATLGAARYLLTACLAVAWRRPRPARFA